MILKNDALTDIKNTSSFSFLDFELKNIQIVDYGVDTQGTVELTILAVASIKYFSKKDLSLNY